ncbi:MAG: acetoacetate--CoA ligase [Candidatus Promineifilaceae bacterium]|nr:acetoacetate--CoA ligase [Candidatus Promineifilaceae bacterium]
MNEVSEGDLLWEPSEAVKEEANLTAYMAWLEDAYGLSFGSYRELWEWSTDEIAAFWRSIWEYFEVQASQEPSEILAERKMPGAKWFEGARLNYAENVFAKMKRDGPAVLYQAEEGPLVEIGREELFEKVKALARALRGMGVGRGDRVVAYMPNIPETIVGLLATASLGAIWSSCSPDFGTRSVLDRFTQIEPRVLLTCDGYRYNGKVFNRLQVVKELQASLPTLEKTILVPVVSDGGAAADLQDTVLWEETLDEGDPSASLSFEQVPFDQPLWVLYSSGTTGLPKPIVHGHGGIVLEHVKETALHMDLKPADRFYWYTSTGWMMWNYLVGGLLTGCTIVLYNGSPGHPDLYVQWKLAAEAGITYFGTSAAFIHTCMQEEVEPGERFDLSHIRAVGSTGSPLSPDGFEWVYENVNENLALESFSGGTDLCTGFLGGVRTRPIYAGEIQHASLGASVRAFDEAGEPVIGEVGELVITEPMPSMPLFFWNDEGNRRYRQSYFEMYPGVWRHGDWIKINERGGCVIYGRSDATINRYGVRMGTSEIYQTVETLEDVVDSLAVDLEGLEGEPYMPLFVVLREGAELDDELKQRIRQALREELSPRHVPDEIVAVDEIPYTLSGKKMELPVRRVLQGQPLEEAANPGAMRNPGAIDFYASFAERRRSKSEQ